MFFHFKTIKTVFYVSEFQDVYFKMSSVKVLHELYSGHDIPARSASYLGIIIDCNLVNFIELIGKNPGKLIQ